MKSLFALIFIFINHLVTYSQNDLIGKYYSINNKFERWSIIELKNDGKFIYKYGLSGCQSEINGTYLITKNKIKFKNDTEFINQSIKTDSLTPIYPDMSLTEWIIFKDYIKPIEEINTGCIKEKGKHRKHTE